MKLNTSHYSLNDLMYVNLYPIYGHTHTPLPTVDSRTPNQIPFRSLLFVHFQLIFIAQCPPWKNAMNNRTLFYQGRCPAAHGPSF